MESGARGEVEGCGFVGFRRNVACTDYGVAIGETEVQEGGLGDGGRLEEGIEAGDSLGHGSAQEGVAEAGWGRVFEIGAKGIEGIQIESECLSRISLATVGRCLRGWQYIPIHYPYYPPRSENIRP